MISMLQQLEKQFETLQILESPPVVDASPSDIRILPNECDQITEVFHIFSTFDGVNLL